MSTSAPATEIADPSRRRAADGLLHRHDGVHRLQGVRGRLQAVERPARGRLAVRQGRLLRPHRGSVGFDLAPRPVRRAARALAAAEGGGAARARAGGGGQLPAIPASCRAGGWRAAASTWRRGGAQDGRVGVHVRRLQALHQRGLPRCLPHRRADPHRASDGGAAAGRLQRLRLLRAGVPVRRRRPRPRWTGAPASARSATTASRTGSSRPARSPARPTRSSSAPTRSWCEIASRRVAELHGRGIEGAYLYGAGDEPDEQLAGGLGAFFLLTEPPERYGLPAHADSPVQENVVPATLAAVGAGLLAGAGAVVAFVAAARRGLAARPAEVEHVVSDRASTSADSRRADGRPGAALGTRGGAGPWTAAEPGAPVALARPDFGDAQWSYLYKRRDTGYAARRAGARAGRRGEPADARRAGPGDPRAVHPRTRVELGGRRSTSGSAGWRRARRSSRSPATPPATTAPPRSPARSRSAPSRPRRSC